jgi:acyl dehydratase
VVVCQNVAMAPPTRHLEDFRAGEEVPLGSFTLDEAEIVEFARRFDPQPFHTDAEAAAASPFGGLIASGWHTASAAMRLMVDNLIPRETAMGSPGVDELRWTRPVRPGDTISVTYRVLEVVPSRSKDDRGHVVGQVVAVNQDGEVVMTYRGRGIYRRRPPA